MVIVYVKLDIIMIKITFAKHATLMDALNVLIHNIAPNVIQINIGNNSISYVNALNIGMMLEEFARNVV
jgi:hypothetical protein